MMFLRVEFARGLNLTQMFEKAQTLAERIGVDGVRFEFEGLAFEVAAEAGLDKATRGGKVEWTWRRDMERVRHELAILEGERPVEAPTETYLIDGQQRRQAFMLSDRRGTER
jgi:hypothetical protein